MNDNHSILPGVGDNASVDHVCVQVGNGMLIGATTLFTKLGYTENGLRRKTGHWGEARFLEKTGSIPVQLTHSADEKYIPAGENHIAIMVENPRQAAMALIDWLDWAGITNDGAEQYGDNWFVTVSTLLVQPLEFVPMR